MNGVEQIMRPSISTIVSVRPYVRLSVRMSNLDASYCPPGLVSPYATGGEREYDRFWQQMFLPKLLLQFLQQNYWSLRSELLQRRQWLWGEKGHMSIVQRILHSGTKPRRFETSNHSLLNERGSEWASEQTSEQCKRSSKQMTEWPSTAVWILDYSAP